jgi:hypothetical protein
MNMARSILVETAHGFEWRKEKANARLIAAAPDMLAALRLLVELYKDEWRNFPNLPETCGEAAWRKALAAIAKAEGKQ